MKKTRLLEIVREEINEALNALVTTKDGKTISMPYTTQDEKESIDVLKQDSNVINIKTTAGKNIKESELEEDLLNEKPFIDSAFDITGTSPETFNQDSLQNAIDDAVKVLQKENPDADVKKLAGELQKVNSAKNLGPNSKLSPELKSALQKVANIIEKQGEIFGNKSKIDDLIKLAKDPSQIDRLEKLKSKGYTFILGNAQAVTAIEKSLGLKPKNNDSLLADKTKSTEKSKIAKPKAEKPEPTGKKGRPAGSGEKKSVRTPGDDGFDKVEYVDVKDEDKEATQNIGSDSTAKELGTLATGKEETFNRILGLVTKYKDDKAKVDAFISKAENEYKLPSSLLKQLKLAAGRDVKI
jgi:hypothetical protein